MNEPYDINIGIISYTRTYEENGTVQISRKKISKKELVEILTTLSTDIQGKNLSPYLEQPHNEDEELF
jgi:hypothetical protein